MTPNPTPTEGVEDFDSARELAPNTSAARSSALPPVSEQTALERAREAFFCLIADARRWEVDVDGDADEYGRPIVTVTHFGEFQDSSLRDLLEALEIPIAFDEPTEAALDRAMEKSLK